MNLYKWESGMSNTVKVLLLSIALGVLMIGGGIGALIVNNRMIADRQIRAETVAKKEKDDAESKQRAEELVSQAVLNGCLQRAEDAYWSYVKINATSTKQTPDGPVYTAYQNTWDYADKQRQSAKDDCYKAQSN
jgi:cytochrome c biogenesis protein ResB